MRGDEVKLNSRKIKKKSRGCLLFIRNLFNFAFPKFIDAARPGGDKKTFCPLAWWRKRKRPHGYQ